MAYTGIPRHVVDTPERDEQVILRDGKFIRLRHSNLFAEPYDCPVVKIGYTPSGFYRYSEAPGSFLAYDVTALWDQRFNRE